MGRLEAIFATKTRDEWSEIITRADVPNSPVFDLHHAVLTEQAVHNGSMLTIGQGEQSVKVARNPIRVQAWGDDIAEQVHGMGSDTRDVLRELLGKDDAAIAALVDANVVATTLPARD